jgi:hypothetical protein
VTDDNLGQARAAEARTRALDMSEQEQRQFLRRHGWRKATARGAEVWSCGDGMPARTISLAVAEVWFRQLSADRWQP